MNALRHGIDRYAGLRRRGWASLVSDRWATSTPMALICLVVATPVAGQIVTPAAPTSFQLPDRTTTLRDQLINRLRATTPSQQAFIQAVIVQVDRNRLSAARVVALERYARRRAVAYPFPTFERAVRFEAGRLGIALPSVELIQRAAAPPPRPGG